MEGNYFEKKKMGGIKKNINDNEKIILSINDLMKNHTQEELKSAYNVLITLEDVSETNSDLVEKLKKTKLTIAELRETIFKDEIISNTLEEELNEIFSKMKTSEREIVTLRRKILNGTLDKISINVFDKEGNFILERELSIDRTNINTIINSLKTELISRDNFRDITDKAIGVETHIGLVFEEF